MNTRRLFVASCLALLTTSMVFSIRGDIVDALCVDFQISKQQMGEILSPAFWGFALSIIVAGSLVDWLGMRNLLLASSLGYIVAILMILFSPRPVGPVASIFGETGTTILYAGMLLIGLSQGLVEAVINPLVATIHSDDKTSKLNALHAWWPGGLVIGGVIAVGWTKVPGLAPAGRRAAPAPPGRQIEPRGPLLPPAPFRGTGPRR